MRWRTGSYSLLVISLLGPVEAQTPKQPGSVRVLAIDSVSREVLLRTILWELHHSPTGGWNARSGMADSTGVMYLDGITAWPVQVACAGKRLLEGHKLFDLEAAAVARMAPADTLRLRVDGTVCDRRPLLAEYGMWVGHYVSGFEESRLVLCGDSARGIWVEYAKDLFSKPQPEWPASTDPHYPRYFVTFRGRMIGPYHYGHLGVADYELTVDSVLFARSPGATDCKSVLPGRPN